MTHASSRCDTCFCSPPWPYFHQLSRLVSCYDTRNDAAVLTSVSTERTAGVALFLFFINCRCSRWFHLWSHSGITPLYHTDQSVTITRILQSFNLSIYQSITRSFNEPTHQSTIYSFNKKYTQTTNQRIGKFNQYSFNQKLHSTNKSKYLKNSIIQSLRKQ